MIDSDSSNSDPDLQEMQLTVVDATVPIRSAVHNVFIIENGAIIRLIWTLKSKMRECVSFFSTLSTRHWVTKNSKL